jgi:hypothetical protein
MLTLNLLRGSFYVLNLFSTCPTTNSGMYHKTPANIFVSVAACPF